MIYINAPRWKKEIDEKFFFIQDLIPTAEMRFEPTNLGSYDSSDQITVSLYQAV